MKKLFSTLLLFYCCAAEAQNAFSLTTDLSVLRNLGENQGFTAIGQTVQFQYHFKPKEIGYAWISYYSPGRYQNTLTATAKDPTTVPPTLDYTISSEIRYRQISLGWKHFFKGWYDSEEPFNIYGSAGFGILFSKITNTYSQPIDSTVYMIPAKAAAGSDEARRLTFDLALGTEIRLGAGIYFYTDVRTWLQASSTPSPYYYDNRTPQVIMLNGGLRVLFD
ncbi:hypothetical protein [Flavisolibacter tropicus]|uniref:hypothetical protein n=1 Tax=Flavisolibacter tropicus TaxID=1492898 RepID=UPI000B2B19D2|nr:hypothetical protein [Flavisolibacter tropicus]